MKSLNRTSEPVVHTGNQSAQRSMQNGLVYPSDDQRRISMTNMVFSDTRLRLHSPADTEPRNSSGNNRSEDSLKAPRVVANSSSNSQNRRIPGNFQPRRSQFYNQNLQHELISEQSPVPGVSASGSRRNQILHEIEQLKQRTNLLNAELMSMNQDSVNGSFFQAASVAAIH